MALKKYALNPAEREKECTHELGFQYSGTIPNTGLKVCRMCGTNEESCTRDMTCQDCGLEVTVVRGMASDTSGRCDACYWKCVAGGG